MWLDVDVGVLYIEVSGCLLMCGYGMMGVVIVLVEIGMVEVIELVIIVCFDILVGLVVVDVMVSDGVVISVILCNVVFYFDEVDVCV